MKIPVSPPLFTDLLRTHAPVLGDLLCRRIGPEVQGIYEHWDHLRQLTPPQGLMVEQWWLGIKLARHAAARDLPLQDRDGRPMRIAITDAMASKLHAITQQASGSLRGLDQIDDERARQKFVMRSQIEEAMTSSQLEGAGTTRAVAKDMLRSGRNPRDRCERMIHNNFLAMQALRRWKDQSLTPAAVFEIHRQVTDGTLDDPDQSGRLRTQEDNVVIEDDAGRLLHLPPAAQELPQRLQALCDFANGVNEEGFLHPVVRAIALHFQIGYDHPFCEGNGRTARALFYWSMLRSGYWLTEYLSISSVLKQAKAQYLRAYLHTETDESDLGYFVDHHLNVIVQAMDGLHSYLAKKVRERNHAETLLKPTSRLGAALNHRQRELLLDAVRHSDKVYRIDRHMQVHGVTYQTARTDLSALAELKLMHCQRMGRAFIYTPVADLAARLRT
ncbi:Filamentation induced by cAMP protein Fic [uncultured Stenotrophomonas sp.]|uniref:Filamentation induced by cAMP protein Fic n=1 Tax=uncultured Stenotrophomonas sp. TaxID=165438 RepID=A0A1Y5Q8R0_9GAMM|nr:Filamentation induced by cAMP protein Fic [uncultured Stenotrophomonas sp.]